MNGYNQTNTTPSSNTNERVPTVNDLRVKLCYICREEESPDSPAQEGPLRAWTHPCSCTLIAHEQCLLKWIQTSQSSSSRAGNALKCPQCSTAYELESNDPVILRLLTIGNKTLQRFGRYFTLFGAASVIGIVGTSVYICLTAYGAWAIEKFIGKELFQEILTDDPTNWPWSAYFNLPLIPISLVLSRFQTTPSMTVPLLLIWPPSIPLSARERSQRLQSSISLLTPSSTTGGLSSLNSLPFNYSPNSWPPPPLIFGIVGLPIVRALYKQGFARLYEWVLGTPMPVARRGRRGVLQFDEGPFVIRIRNGNGDEGDQALPPLAAPEAADGEANPNPNPNPNAAAVEAAGQLLEINASSLGRRVGGALLIPAVSSFMGTLLLRLSKRSNVLRLFLGIREQQQPRVSGLWGVRYPWSLDLDLDRPWNELKYLQRARVGLKMVTGVFWAGSRSWIDSDPAWWRNCVGFGLFIVIKDCVQLLHLWLAKRELESRRVKDRDFKGVDIRELDLLPSFLQTR